MVHEEPCRYVVVAVAALLLVLGCDCGAQERAQDHSCTVHAAGALALPEGKDGNNFEKGWGFQAGGGFAISRPAEPDRGNSWYITGNFMYQKFRATSAALAEAKAANPTQLANATSAHGGFSAVTLDPTIRHAFGRRYDVYGVGGVGWLRRGVGFNGANPGTLLHSNGFTLDRLASNSGVFDLGGGVNFSPNALGGFMLFAEARVYRGLAINSGSTLVPLSLGIRW